MITENDQSATMSELVKLMGIPDAIYDPSVAAPSLGAIGEFRDNESDSEENVTGVIAEGLAKPECSHMPGCREFQQHGNAIKLNLLKKIKGG